MPATSFESLEPRRLFNLDPSFGTSGVATIDLGEGVTMRPADVAVASDGGVVAVGAANDDNTAVTVRYKIPAPGGLWDAADNGDYIIRLRSREAGVRTPANDIFAIGQVLGAMTVDL